VSYIYWEEYLLLRTKGEEGLLETLHGKGLVVEGRGGDKELAHVVMELTLVVCCGQALKNGWEKSSWLLLLFLEKRCHVGYRRGSIDVGGKRRRSE